MSNSIFDKTTNALGSSLNFRLLRHNVATANIANAETPGYKAKKVDFEEALARAIDLDGKGELNTSDPDHYSMGPGAISRARADIYDNPDVDMSNDGNTVDMDREMTQLGENSIIYKAAVQLINKKLAMLRYGVTEGTK